VRINLKIFPRKERLTIPLNYNYHIQGFIYNNISPPLARFLHDRGFSFEKRSFKMFTFSKLYGKYRIHNGCITFSCPIELIISSPLNKFVEELANFMLKKEALNICGEDILIEEIKVCPEPEIRDEIKIRMLTPAVNYSTLMTKDGRKKTYYYSPYEEEFVDLTDKNLRKKYEAFCGKKPRARKLKIKVIGKPKEKILKYRDNIIKGYIGKFILNGNRKLLKLGYDTGIGSKNSQGFGMFEVLND
jgi:CRISPR-associated endoribonuclease Cas6